jgi:Cof subfamily protein (haloacid dehalogenase superfamily)
MLKKFKAICTDIDGTLLDKNKELSQRTIRAFGSLEDDIPVILASSRMPSAMRHLQQQLNILNNPLICFNGGYVIHYNQSRFEVLDTVLIPVAVCAEIIALTKDTDVHISLYCEDEWHAPKMDQWTEREIKNTKVEPVFSLYDQVLEKWQKEAKGGHKVMAMGPEEEIKVLGDMIEKIYGNDLHVYRSKSTYLEIAPKTISKASALELLLKSNYNIAMEEVVAFGDNYNDIEMLQKAGLGVAVGNAREEVKSVANEITLPNIEDGVAVCIEKYFI